ncbi:MAG TPA: hypothetical protein VF187_01575 [Gemmatimonadales bacterium]
MRATRSRRFAGIGSLFLVAIATGCSESGQAPLSPSELKPNFVLVQSTTGWDFTGLIGTLAGCQDWGTAKTVSQAGFGSIDLTTSAPNSLTSKGLELAVGATERGLGLALNSPCNGDEVGDGGQGSLFMDFNNVAPVGSTLTQIDLGSVQGTATASTQEGWEIWYSTNGKGDGSTGYALLSSGFGDGVNNTGDNITITGAPLPLPTANLVLRFQKYLAAPGNATTDNDYTIKSVTTAHEESEGCTFTLGYWKTHTGLGPQADAWPTLPLDGNTKLALGTVHYTKTQLISIFNTAPKGNGLITLAHQLIAAKLNILNGADDTDISATITAADALIGSKVVPPVGNGYLSPASVSSLVTALNNFNTGITGPDHCDEEVIF